MLTNALWINIKMCSLPGKALATGETIWLCNAQHAETKLFTRSLLARVCMPSRTFHVVETFITVFNDPNLTCLFVPLFFHVTLDRKLERIHYGTLELYYKLSA